MADNQAPVKEGPAKSGKVKVTIVKRFMLTHGPGRHEVIDPGDHMMDKDMAEHWFVRAHSDDPLPEQPSWSSRQYVEMRDKFAADEALDDDAERQAAAEAAAAARADFAKNQRGKRRASL